MADLNISLIVRAVDRLTAPVKKITRTTERLTETVRRAGKPTRALTERQRGLRLAVERVTRSLRDSQDRLRQWGAAAGRATRAASDSFRRAGLVMAGLGALGYLFKRTFVGTAADFERFRTVLETIEGSSEKAQTSMDWISDFAVTTPFELAQVTDAFVKLRAYGMDPTQGLLRDLGDASSAMGKPLMQAVEAIADAVTGENERLKEFGIKARAEGNLFRYEYTVDGETRIAEAMADDRAAIERTLRDIFAARGFTGAMEKESKTFRGLVSNLSDQWTRFANTVMEAGAFDFLKSQLEGWLNALNRMVEDGSLQELAERVGRQIVSAFREMARAIREVWPWVVRIGGALSWAAEKLGGWHRLAALVAGLYIARPFIGLAGALRGVASWAGKALRGVRKVAAAPAAPTHMLGGTRYTRPAAMQAMTATPKAGGIALLGGVFRGLGAVLGLVSIKLLAVGAVVALVAGLVYKYWEPVKALFKGVWDGFTEALQPVIDLVRPFFAQIGEWLSSAAGWFRELLVPVEMTGERLSGFAAAGKLVGQALGTIASAILLIIPTLGKLIIDLVRFGARMADAIVGGLKGVGERLAGGVKGVLGKVRDLLPFSDARRGPLSRLTASGASILETMGLGVLRAGPGGLQRPLARTLGTAAAGLALAGGGAGTAIAARSPTSIDRGIHIQQLIIQQQPGEDAGALADKVLREIEARQQQQRHEALYDEL